ncbi:MAG TPA: hydroxyacylglutathione hydrolase [Gammaproteobacteria bacterium]|nr:hydroxyacylglutathione hydrolase [Gammaproteobacteria bacterium]
MTYTLTPLPAFADNYIWLLADMAGNAAVVDPGDAAPVQRTLDARNLKLRAVLATHHHPDHVGGAAELASRHGCPVFGPAREAGDVVTVPLEEGQQLEVSGLGVRFRVLDIPGHTAGHIAFVGSDILFSGDTLFSAGCGRLFEGTPAQMSGSLAKLAALPESVRVCCGHEYTVNNLRFAAALEPDNLAIREHAKHCIALRARGEVTLPSTIAMERRINPFLRCSEPAVREAASRHAGESLTDPVEIFAVIRQWKDGFG